MHEQVDSYMCRIYFPIRNEDRKNMKGREENHKDKKTTTDIWGRFLQVFSFPKVCKVIRKRLSYVKLAMRESHC